MKPSIIIYFFLFTVILLIFCSEDVPDKHINDKNTESTDFVNVTSPYEILSLNFRVNSIVDSMPEEMLTTFKQLVFPDSIRIYNFHGKNPSTSTDRGRKLNFYGINDNWAFIVYDRLSCRAGKRILIIFSISNKKYNAIWAGDIQSPEWTNNIADVKQIKSLFENGHICNRPLTMNYML